MRSYGAYGAFVPYVAPYRRAVLEWLSHNAPFTAEDLRAQSGQPSLAAAKAQTTRLCRAGVLVEVAPGSFMAGPQSQAYRDARPRTKPGGHNKIYMEKLAAQQRAKGLEFQRARAGEATPSLTGQKRRRSDNGMVSAAAAARIIGVSRWTMARWAHTGRVRSVITPTGRILVDRRQLERIAPWQRNRIRRQQKRQLRKRRSRG